jgi:hypothetical protein
MVPSFSNPQQLHIAGEFCMKRAAAIVIICAIVVAGMLVTVILKKNTQITKNIEIPFKIKKPQSKIVYELHNIYGDNGNADGIKVKRNN